MADSSNASNWLYTKLTERIKAAKLNPFLQSQLVSRLQKANKLTEPAQRAQELLAIADEFLEKSGNPFDAKALESNIKEVKGYVQPREVKEEPTKEEEEDEPKDTKSESFGGKLSDSANQKRKNDYDSEKSTTNCGSNPKHAKTEAAEPTVVEKVEKIVKDCATQAEDQINQKVFNRKSAFSTRPEGPAEKECDETVTHPRTGEQLPQRVLLGEWKHKAAEDCIKVKLPDQGLQNVCKVEQSFDYSGNATGRALNTIRPDVVVHAPGNPNKVEFVFDMKYPCPPGGTPKWRYMPATEFEKNYGLVHGVDIKELTAKGIRQDKLYAAVLELQPDQLKLVKPR